MNVQLKAIRHDYSGSGSFDKVPWLPSAKSVAGSPSKMEKTLAVVCWCPRGIFRRVLVRCTKMRNTFFSLKPVLNPCTLRTREEKNYSLTFVCLLLPSIPNVSMYGFKSNLSFANGRWIKILMQLQVILKEFKTALLFIALTHKILSYTPSREKSVVRGRRTESVFCRNSTTYWDCFHLSMLKQKI